MTPPSLVRSSGIHTLAHTTTHTHSTQGQGIPFLPTIIYNRPRYTVLLPSFFLKNSP